MDDETEEPETFEKEKKLKREKLMWRLLKKMKRKDSTPNKTCEKEKGDE